MDEPPSPAATTSPATPPARMPGWPRTARSLAASRGVDWWSEGWRVFMAAPGTWIGIIVVLVVVMIVLSFVPLLGNIAQAILWPLFAGGLFLGCHTLAQGRPLAFGHLFAGFQEGRAGALVILGLISLAVGVVLFFVIALFVFGAVGMSGMAGMMTGGDPTTAMTNAIAGASVAALIAMPIVIVAAALFLMAWWFATPLVALNGASPLDALRASFDASWKNLGALTIFGLIYIVLAIAASIPFGLGWLVLGPVAIGANYASWREVFGE